MAKLSLGYSPCPNDTYIFDAMVHQKIDTEGLEFDLVLDDVEALNRRAEAGEIDITKLSYHAFAYLTDKYQLLHAGSALGNNCGPLLIARSQLSEEAIRQGPIAIPGNKTTANFLLSLAYPNAQHKVEYVFSEIEDAVASGEAAAGLIIHENRFTYEQKGLVKLIDLGEYWESTTGLPIPLGGIVVKREFSSELKNKINRVLTRSVAFAFEHPDAVMPYVRKHAQAMDDAVMQAHINLYVTRYTLDLGQDGRRAVQQMFAIARSKQLIPDNTEEIFIN